MLLPMTPNPMNPTFAIRSIASELQLGSNFFNENSVCREGVSPPALCCHRSPAINALASPDEPSRHGASRQLQECACDAPGRGRGLRVRGKCVTAVRAAAQRSSPAKKGSGDWPLPRRVQGENQDRLRYKPLDPGEHGP